MLPTGIRSIHPNDIEAASFAIIEEELGPHSFPRNHFALVRRVIHAHWRLCLRPKPALSSPGGGGRNCSPSAREKTCWWT